MACYTLKEKKTKRNDLISTSSNHLWLEGQTCAIRFRGGAKYIIYDMFFGNPSLSVQHILLDMYPNNTFQTNVHVVYNWQWKINPMHSKHMVWNVKINICSHKAINIHRIYQIDCQSKNFRKGFRAPTFLLERRKSLGLEKDSRFVS